MADVSSCFLSEPVDVSKYGIIYGGVQKNIGPAGMVIAIIREDLITEDVLPGTPTIPVIAAGGIADGRGIAAAFMLGAKAVQMGTHFVATTECWAHQNYKDMILKAKDIDTKVTGRSTGHPVRALRNQMTKEYLKKEAEGVPFEELEQMTLGSLRRAVVDGDVKMGSVMAGQSAGLVKEQMSCQELIRKLVKETDALLKGTGIYE